jgi:peptidoglycan/xylan/chitin deacetylase (PgdA/CDA1 family)/SAM-dependent methyltransferase
MTARSVGTIVRCGDQIAAVYDSVETIARQSIGAGPVAIVADATTPAAAMDWLRAFARSRGAVLVQSDGEFPAAGRNAGIAALEAEFVMCVDAGDRLDRRMHQAILDAFADDASVGIVAPAVQHLGPGSESRLVTAERTDLEALISSSDTIPPASAFRVAAWRAAGGFDEALPCCEEYDFWIRVLSSGQRCAIVPDALLVRRLRRDALYRREWDPERRGEAIRGICAKHHALFTAHAALALCAREVSIGAAAAEYQRAMVDHRATLTEIEGLELETRAGASAPVEFADLRRTSPIARNWGYERGTPVDRYYIEAFLDRCKDDVHGAVLEVQEADYTARFGGSRVTRSDVVDLNPANSRATVISDLRAAANIADETYDCIIVTQTLHVIGDMPAVIAECVRMLKPGGVLLATLPCASRICLEYGDEGDCWRVTEAGARRLFADALAERALDVRSAGNVLASAAFLYGVASEELTAGELDANDPFFALVVTVRAQKPHDPGPTRARQADQNEGLILLYHRVASPGSDVHGMAIRPSDFRDQIAYLERHCTPMPLDALIAMARAQSLPPRAVAVTFDDGYLDNLEEASPILSEYRIPATFFVTTDQLNRTESTGSMRSDPGPTPVRPRSDLGPTPVRPRSDPGYVFWWDVLEAALLGARSGGKPDLALDLPAGRGTFAMNRPHQRLAAHTAIYDAIVGLPAAARDAVIEQIVRWNGVSEADLTSVRRMNADEIVALANRPGHAIGAHSVRHLMLTRQPVPVQRDEANESRRALEALLDRPVRAFAYPFGACSDETVDAVRGAGFDAAVTCRDAGVSSGSDPLMLPRIEAPRAGSSAFGAWLEWRFTRLRAARP